MTSERQRRILNMATRSTIMDGNSYRGEQTLDPLTQQLVEKRSTMLGAAYRLFYREPVHLVRGKGQYLWDRDGKKYLDLYNNVPCLGHAHPAVIAAVTEQMKLLNTHTRYLHEKVVTYAEDILGTLPGPIDQIMFMCTGSEANDLAIRVAREYTGGQVFIITSEAYHGNTDLTSGFSPALGSEQPLHPDVVRIAPPDTYHAAEGDPGITFARRLQATIDDILASGRSFAGFMADSIFSSDGVFAGQPGMLKPAVDVVHANGGVFIADEVQPGFARTGDSFWGFGRHGGTPDIVTMGKPMGNGIPISGMAAQTEVLEAFSRSLPYFNTFGGNPVSIAAAQAVLDVIKAEGLQEKARVVGGAFREALTDLSAIHPEIGDVRGAGQFTGLELVTDPVSQSPDRDLALSVIEFLRSRGVLTSVAGPHSNVLKLRPPLAFDTGDIDWVVTALDAAIVDAREELGR